MQNLVPQKAGQTDLFLVSQQIEKAKKLQDSTHAFEDGENWK